MSKNKNTYFIDNANNYDIDQSLDMMNYKNNMIKKLNKVENKDIDSINSKKDYLGYLNKSNLNKSNLNIYELDNKNSNVNFNVNLNRKENTKENANYKHDLKKSIDLLVMFMYLIIMITLVISVFFNNKNFIIQLILVNLLFIFIKIFLKVY